MKSNLQEDFIKHYELHKDMVFRIAMTYVKNVEDARDIVQDTFLRLGTYRGRFIDEEHCKRWLIRVCINLSKDYLKSFWRSKCDGSDDAMRKLESIPTVDERDNEILAEVFALPNKYKAVIYLHYYEEYDYKEISQILGISLSGVKMRAKRGKEMLKLKLFGNYSAGLRIYCDAKLDPVGRRP